MTVASKVMATDGDVSSVGVVSQVPDLTGVSLEQVQRLDNTVLSYAVQRVLAEAEAGIGHHLAGYNPAAF